MAAKTVPQTIMTCLFVMLITAGLPQRVTAAGNYRHYANAMFRALPGKTKFRPDLERYLNRLASITRKQAGLKPLTHSSLATWAARAQSAEMILGDFVGHQSRGGFSFSQRLAAYRGRGYVYAGENAARDRLPGKPDAKKAWRLFNLWINSPGHLRNLMRPKFTHVSTGVIQNGNHLYAVQIFWAHRSKKYAQRRGPRIVFGRGIRLGLKFNFR